MKPIDFSRENWKSLRARICDDREAVWRAWLQHGPGTTEEVARRAGWNVLSFRPRTTDLMRAGFVVCTGRAPNRKAGMYRGCSEAEAMAAFRRAQAALVSGQLSLGL